MLPRSFQDIWNHEGFLALSTAARAVFLFMHTSPELSPFGCIRANSAGLAMAYGMSHAKFRKALSELVAAGMAITGRNFIFLPWLMAMKRPESPNVARSWARGIARIPEAVMRREAWGALARLCRRLGAPWLAAIGMPAQQNLPLGKPDGKAAAKGSGQVKAAAKGAAQCGRSGADPGRQESGEDKKAARQESGPGAGALEAGRKEKSEGGYVQAFKARDGVFRISEKYIAALEREYPHARHELAAISLYLDQSRPEKRTPCERMDAFIRNWLERAAIAADPFAGMPEWRKERIRQARRYLESLAPEWQQIAHGLAGGDFRALPCPV